MIFEVVTVAMIMMMMTLIMMMMTVVVLMMMLMMLLMLLVVTLAVCIHRDCVAQFMKRRGGITVKAALLMQVTCVECHVTCFV